MMYRVMVTFDPMQCVATPLDSQTQQPRPSYERAWLPVTDDQARDDGASPARDSDEMRVGGVIHCSEQSSQGSHSRQQQTRAVRTNNWIPREEDYDLEEESVMMVKLEKDLKSKNISQLEQENFYEKLMVLKHEQADHIRLVERVYRSEVYMEQEDTSQPRSILKTSNLEERAEGDYCPPPRTDNSEGRHPMVTSSSRDRVREIRSRRPGSSKSSSLGSSVSLPCSPCSSDPEDTEEESVMTVRKSNIHKPIKTKRILRRQQNIAKSQSSNHPTSGKFRTDADSSGKENKTPTNKRSPPLAKKFIPTVPEPFEMTIREDNKRRERLLAIQSGIIENFNKPETKTINCEEEQFRAIEMPSHVLENRYEKIVKMQQKKKKRAKEAAEKKVRETIRPFKFAEREEQKNNLRRSDSVPNLKINCQKDFQANPFPEHLFTDFAYEQQRERAHYREIQRKLRQEMLLKNSNFPPRMASEFKKMMHENKGLSKQSKSLPRKVKRGKTDLDRLYREYQEKLERKRMENKMLVGIEKAKAHDSIPQPNPRRRPQSADSARQKKFSTNLDKRYEYEDIEKSYNTTAMLRLKLLNERKMQYDTAKMSKDAEERTREERLRRRRMNNPSWDNIRNVGGDKNEVIMELTRRRLEEEKLRMENYKLELEHMMTRVENQPTLFQKQSQACAKKSIEKKFNEVLQKQGIDSDEIEKIWKLLPRTSDNRSEIGLVRGYQEDIIHNMPEKISPDGSEVDQDEDDEDFSEQDLADSVSLNLSPVKEHYS